jgi:hypothetical protein
METRSTGLVIIGVGIFILVVGLLVYTGALSWFGRLPGDIRIESEHTQVYIPITSMLLVSLVLTVISSLVHRFF